MPNDKPDLLTRAQAAAQEVTRLKNERITLGVLLKKAKAEAASLRRQVIGAMGPPKTRMRRKKPAGHPACYKCEKPSVAAISDGATGMTIEVCAEHKENASAPATKCVHGILMDHFCAHCIEAEDAKENTEALKNAIE